MRGKTQELGLSRSTNASNTLSLGSPARLVWARDVGPVDDLRCVHEVAVGIDERGHERLARQVHDLGSVGPGFHHLGLGARCDDAAAGYGDCLNLPSQAWKVNR